MGQRWVWSLMVVWVLCSVGPGGVLGKTTLMVEDVNYCHPFHVLGSGSTQNHTTLANAIASTSNPDCSGNKVLLLTPGTWTIGADLTIPDRMAVEVPQGALLAVSGGVTLTLDCRKLVASTYPVFSGSGTVACSNTPYVVAYGASLTFAVDVSSVQAVTLTGNVTSVALTNGGALLARGSLLWLRFVQDATGGRTVSGWPGTVLWTSGGAPVLDTRANATTLIGLLYDGTQWRDIHVRRALGVPEAQPVWARSGACVADNAPIPAAGGAVYPHIWCTDVATDCLYATAVRLPAGWSALSGVLVQGMAIHTGTPTSEVLSFDIAAQCRTSGATMNDTWGTAQALTFTFTTVDQLLAAQTPALTPQGTCSGSTLTAPLTVNLRACVNPTTTVCATCSAVKVVDLHVLFLGP